MLVLIPIMILAACYVEIKVMKSVPWFGNLLAQYRMASLGFSLFLSMALGAVFGAYGLICFAAGLGSTVAMQPYYAMWKSGQLEQVEIRYAEFKSTCRENKEIIIRRTQQILAILIFTWKVATLPFKVLFKILDGIDSLTNKTRRAA